MQALGITDDDFEIAWAVLDADQSGEVSYKEFVTCLCTMKSSDTHFMLTYMKYYITWMRGAIMEQIKEHHRESQIIEKKLQETIEVVEEQEEALLRDEDLILNKMKADPGAEGRSRAEEQADKDKPAASSKCNESVLPEPDAPPPPPKKLSPSYGYLLPSWGGSTPTKDLMSASVDDAMQACLQKVGDEIEVMRNELKGSLEGIDRRLGQQISRIQAKQQVVAPDVPQSGSDLRPKKGAETILEVKGTPSKLQGEASGLPLTYL